jgi:cellulose synthase/poly-beta-1,6-N-acetylglucosamine synthase-like glycosyltransferase
LKKYFNLTGIWCQCQKCPIHSRIKVHAPKPYRQFGCMSTSFYVSGILIVVECVVFIYFIYVISFTTFFSIMGLLYRPAKVGGKAPKFSRFCILIPGYREDSIILKTAQHALNQSYPSAFYKVVVIADSFQKSTIQQLTQLPIDVLEVSFAQSTKVKSLNSALARLQDFDYAVILDADNEMCVDFLEKINDLMVMSGLKAVQTERKPKNENSRMAFLDGLSEAINNHVYRKGAVVPGPSSSISGSGTVFDFSMIKTKLASMESVGGFDRELELLLLADGIRVYYYDAVCVYDEKVSNTTTFQNQRRRWISSQYFYLRKYAKRGFQGLLGGDFAIFTSAVLRNVQLPRLLNIGLFSLMIAALFIVRDRLFIPYPVWVIFFVVYVFSIFLAIPREFLNRKLLGSLFELPIIFYRMVLIMFRLRGANKKFIHTPHGAGTQSKIKDS